MPGSADANGQAPDAVSSEELKGPVRKPCTRKWYLELRLL